MQKKIIALTDYKGNFGSSHNSAIYRGGMDKNLLTKFANDAGYDLEFIKISTLNFRKYSFLNVPVIYTSQEDIGYFYKDFIEDIVLGLELAGAQVIPPYKFLRSNNNKVFMEIMRDIIQEYNIKNIKSYMFGCFEEALDESDNFNFPVVVKAAKGAQGEKVALANNIKELKIILKNFSKTRNRYEELKEVYRLLKYTGYIKESKFRNKFIIQDFIPGLANDWKVYYFNNCQYTFKRPVFKHRGFRASGGGYDNYIYGSAAHIPYNILDFSDRFCKLLDVPHASLDFAVKDKEIYLFEFQFVYFGSAGIINSDDYYIRYDNGWKVAANRDRIIEKVYMESITDYLRTKG